MYDQDYKRMTSNHCVYVKKFSNDDIIILLLYVDDMLIVRNNISKIDKLKKTLGDMKYLGATKKFTGICLSCDKREKKIGCITSKRCCKDSRWKILKL